MRVTIEVKNDLPKTFLDHINESVNRASEKKEFAFNSKLDFCLKNIAQYQSFNKMPPIKMGRGGSHIWISDINNNRLIFIH